MLAAEDRLDIHDLYSRWCVLLDTGQAEGWSELFTESGLFVFEAMQVRVEGRDALRSFAADIHARERGLTRHYMHNVLINEDGPAVIGRADIELLDLRAGPDARIIKTANYQDRLERTEDGWRFSERRLYWDTPHAPEEIGTSQWDRAILRAAVPDIERVRRIVTGRGADGRSTIAIDGICPHLRELPDFPTFRFTDLWATSTAPADNGGNADAADGPVSHVPAPGGNVLRLLEIAPDPPGVDMAKSGMHVTSTVDYVYVLSGEITVVLEDGQVALTPGDVLIQRGTVHAWSNRGTEPCVMLGVLVDAVVSA
jgi:mannose-6-phosphate isomerase-like protein (cupin superfamily)/ketosteroid isomerase-like protein